MPSPLGMQHQQRLALQLFSKVMLGPLLGRGSFGAVHRGVWNKRQVAVKVSNAPCDGASSGRVLAALKSAVMQVSGPCCRSPQQHPMLLFQEYFNVK